jgi:putative transposase
LQKSRFSDEQIAHCLRQSQAGTLVVEIVRKLGLSEATFYAWKKVGSMGTAEIRAASVTRRTKS